MKLKFSSLPIVVISTGILTYLIAVFVNWSFDLSTITKGGRMFIITMWIIGLLFFQIYKVYKSITEDDETYRKYG